MKVPENVRQMGIAIRRKMLEEWRESQSNTTQKAPKNVQSKTGQKMDKFDAYDLMFQGAVTGVITEEDSVEAVIAREDRLERRKRQPKPAKKLARKESDPVIVATEPPPEPVVYIAPDPDLHPASGVLMKAACPVTFSLPPEPETEPPPEQTRLIPLADMPLREAPRVPLVYLCQQLVRRHGPLTIDEMIMEIWGADAVGTDDARWLKAQLCKWLTAAAKESGEQFYPKRHRNPARPEARLHRWGFWTEQQPPDRRYVSYNTEVLTAIAELKAELVTLRQIQIELLQRQNLLKEGLAAMLEKLTWNGEV